MFKVRVLMLKGEKGDIKHIYVNGIEQAIDVSTGAVSITVPTKTSDITNDSDFQTGTQVSSAIAAAVGQITSFEYQVVANLPATGETGVIYLVPSGGASPNVYNEYLWVNNAFEMIGSTEMDLSGYEQTINKVTSISSSSTNTQYPSAKAVYDAIYGALGGSY